MIKDNYILEKMGREEISDQVLTAMRKAVYNKKKHSDNISEQEQYPRKLGYSESGQVEARCKKVRRMELGDVVRSVRIGTTGSRLPLFKERVSLQIMWPYVVSRAA